MLSGQPSRGKCLASACERIAECAGCSGVPSWCGAAMMIRARRRRLAKDEIGGHGQDVRTRTEQEETVQKKGKRARVQGWAKLEDELQQTNERKRSDRATDRQSDRSTRRESRSVMMVGGRRRRSDLMVGGVADETMKRQ